MELRKIFMKGLRYSEGDSAPNIGDFLVLLLDDDVKEYYKIDEIEVSDVGILYSVNKGSSLACYQHQVKFGVSTYSIKQVGKEEYFEASFYRKF